MLCLMDFSIESSKLKCDWVRFPHGVLTTNHGEGAVNNGGQEWQGGGDGYK